MNRDAHRSAAALPLLLGLVAGLAPAAPAAAEERRFRFGIAVPLEQAEATYLKAVDNTDPNTLVPPPRRGEVFEDEGSASGPLAGLALLAEYELPLGDGGSFLSAEADFAFHRGALDAQLEGSGTSPSGRQLGEVWPDEWTYEKRRSYGLTLRLGARPGVLASHDAALYVLAALHRVNARMTVHWRGCLSPVPCTPDQFTAGSDPRDLDVLSGSLGAGFEKGFGEHVAIRLEGHYEIHPEEHWVADFPEVAVTVPTTVESGGPGVSLTLLLRR